jgi:hypothetical protein
MAHNGCYALGTVEALMQKCMDLDYEFIEIAEGSLGYGHMILLSHRENYMNVEIQEKYVNCWSSTHYVRKFNKISKRQQKLIDDAHEIGRGVVVHDVSRNG